jgi:hypothetical protein
VLSKTKEVDLESEGENENDGERASQLDKRQVISKCMRMQSPKQRAEGGVRWGKDAGERARERVSSS